MRIACPSCNAAYQVPEEQLRGGRVVRCARCNTDWAPNVALPEPGPAPPISPPDAQIELAPQPPIDATTEPDPEPVPPSRMALDEADLAAPPPAPVPPQPPQPKPPSPQRRSPALVVAWIASLAVVGAAIGYLAVGRADIMRVWPPSIRLYAALGMAPQPAALKTD